MRKLGGWQWYKQIFNVQSWRGEGDDLELCYRCFATLRRGPCYCYNFLGHAMWRSKPRQMDTTYAAVGFVGKYTSALFAFQASSTPA